MVKGWNNKLGMDRGTENMIRTGMNSLIEPVNLFLPVYRKILLVNIKVIFFLTLSAPASLSACKFSYIYYQHKISCLIMRICMNDHKHQGHVVQSLINANPGLTL